MLQNIQNNTYISTILVKRGSLTNIIDWCDENCSENWYFTDHCSSHFLGHDSMWSFIFHSETDFLIFNLKWV